MKLVLRILAYWVVFGLPILLGYRFYKLFKTPGRPRSYYIGSTILFIAIALWIPFVYLRRILGLHVSVFPYLSLHLLGTASGTYLRRTAK